VKTCDGPIFVCVPTPMRPDGSCDTSIVEEVVSKLNAAAVECLPQRDQYRQFIPPHNLTVILKSTLPPGTTDAFIKTYPALRFAFNPEFLREVSAIEDFKHQDRIILGGLTSDMWDAIHMYSVAYPDVPPYLLSPATAEMIKYVANCFLATKVSFANEISQICERLDIPYEAMVNCLTDDVRMGRSHWKVPGPDGKHGFGGACFPKDLNGMIALAKKLDVKTPVLEGAWKTNLNVRPERDWEKLKGRAVS
jgi:UDPglucose 6-dehydrogenase